MKQFNCDRFAAVNPEKKSTVSGRSHHRYHASLEPEITTYPLLKANLAIQELRRDPQRGAKVLLIA